MLGASSAAAGVGTGVARARVVAVIAALPGGREQVGSGFLVEPKLVLTAAHCTVDKATGSRPLGLRVARATDGLIADVAEVVSAPGVDVALVRLGAIQWTDAFAELVYARVDRTQSGVLADCAAIGFPLFQRDVAKRSRQTAELHGMIYQTDEAERGRLLLREPHLTTVSATLAVKCGDDESAWGGLSGALVFHGSRALGVIVEHHPRQGAAAVQLVAFDTLHQRAPSDVRVQDVVDLLRLPPLSALPWAIADPVQPLPGLLTVAAPAGDLPRVNQLDPYRLGASSSDYGDSKSYGLRDPYVPRTSARVDERLRAELQPRRFVLVVGPSKAGKTRTAFEALGAGWPDARVAAADPGTLATLASHPALQTSGDLIVVWLDDLDRFLDSAQPLTSSLLTRLLARPGPTIVLATLRREARDRLRGSSGELTREIRVLLDSACTIELASTAADPDEQAAARAAYPDQPLDGAGLAERLAYAPELLVTYYDSATSDPVLHTLVRVAIDWARAGVPRALPEPNLTDIATDVLWHEHPELDAAPDTVTAALRRARTPAGGTSGNALLLTTPLEGRVRGYHAYDYLTAADDGQSHHPRPIPPRAWKDALDRGTPDDAFAIGVTAYIRNNIPISIRGYQIAADAGHTGAMFNLGYLLADQTEPPDLPAARDWYQRAADAGDTSAMVNLGTLLWGRWEPPDLPAARDWYQRAADAGDTSAMVNLGTLLWGRWEPPDLPAARDWYQRAADAGDTSAMVNLGDLLADRWEPPDLAAARDCYQRAADAGHTDAMFNLATLLVDQTEPPDLAAARDCYQRAADAGHTDAMVNLGNLLADQTEPPDLAAARDWYQRAADAGHTDAMFNLATLLVDQTEPPDLAAAREWLQRAADAGHTDAMFNLAVLLADRWEPPDLAAARDWYQRAADAGHTDAMFSLALLLADQTEPPDLAAARDWYQRAADAGHTDAMVNLALLLADQTEPPDLAAARDWYQRAADAGDTGAMVNLGILLADRWEPPDLAAAREWLQRAADAGHTDAMFNLAVLLADRWEPPDLAAARDCYQRAADAGHTDAMFSLALLLADQTEPPDLAAARDWYQRAADAGHTDAMVNLALLLADQTEPPDLAAARDWYQRAADAGDTGAMVNLGILLADRWEPPDLAAAREWLQRAADAGHTDAMFSLAVLLADRWEPPDLAAARDCYQRAADAGHTDAMFSLAVLLADRWEPPDLATARDWYQRAADAGHTDAMVNLADLLSDR